MTMTSTFDRPVRQYNFGTMSLLVFPATALLLAFLVLPTAVVVVLSFTDYELGMDGLRYIGLSNYSDMLADRVFWQSVRNTALYVALVVPGSIFTALAVALLIERRRALTRFYKVAFFLPVTATLVAMATVWEFILHPSIGLANHLLKVLGVDPVRFLSDPDWAIVSLAVIGIWQSIGFNMVLFLAGLSSIPKEIDEAAALDGAAGGIDRFLIVTWPLLGPTTLFVTITTAINAMRVFESVAVITQGGPNKATEVILYSIYLEAFQYFRTGYASALTVVFLLVTVSLIILQMRVADRKVHY
ncbi:MULTISPECIES: carbohydrate ABC transporter permease [unclassified Neorhizobium]|uniref:carbohydrate ABC transporter permease n=1 Tax=unclassified Neorhizobium TaxID=2629175 RepID=UPI001FF1A124|nr:MULTISPECIES: sugar ABC transporter permease [unclassified Neorhizobium]MCJ9668997.1 sugar ABC transporter permease [Neorhizobium sp. SHOUNA12B]MCJ9744951.1 sugar ABC transporter permease [Neorhizobium sp. SHOUNA12A]